MRQSKKSEGGGLLKPPPGSYRVKVIKSAAFEQYVSVNYLLNDGLEVNENIVFLGENCDSGGSSSNFMNIKLRTCVIKILFRTSVIIKFI